MQIQKFTKNTHILLREANFTGNGETNSFLKTLASAFVAKSIKTLLQIQAGTSANPWKWGQISADQKKGLRNVKIWK